MEKFRTEPETVREMFDWGMISYKTYSHIKHMNIEDAILYCRNIGYLTWTFDHKHLINYINSNNIDTSNKQNLVKFCFKITKGKINPVAVDKILQHYGH